jgi:hypothetical protein
MLDDILAACSRAMLGSGVLMGVLRGLREALAKAEDVYATRFTGRRRCMYVAVLCHGAIVTLYRR